MEISAAVSSDPAPQADCLPLLLPPCGHRMALAPYSLPPPPPGGMKVHFICVYSQVCKSLINSKVTFCEYMYSVHVHNVRFPQGPS